MITPITRINWEAIRVLADHPTATQPEIVAMVAQRLGIDEELVAEAMDQRKQEARPQ